MNKVKLFEKIESISDLKFDISSKLKVYMEIKIRVVCGDIFECITYEELCNKLIGINIGEYIYAFGYVIHNLENECIFVIQDIEKVI